jgi:hypothetical protein
MYKYAAEWPIVEKGDWRGDWGSPKPCIHTKLKAGIEMFIFPINTSKQKIGAESLAFILCAKQL